MSYLPGHTKVTNHLASTQKMKLDIEKEVNKQLGNRNNDNGDVSNTITISTPIVIKGNLDNVTKEELQKQLNANVDKVKNVIYKELRDQYKKY